MATIAQQWFTFFTVTASIEKRSVRLRADNGDVWQGDLFRIVAIKQRPMNGILNERLARKRRRVQR